MPGDAVTIPERLLAEVYLHARETFPDECCGWLLGRDGTAVTVRRANNAYDPITHPTTSERSTETAYVIDGKDLLELNRSLDSDTPALVIYHSHPNGRAYFSDTDQAVAKDPWGSGPMYPVQQLVVGIDESRVVECKLFDWSDAEKTFVEVASLPGHPL